MKFSMPRIFYRHSSIDFYENYKGFILVGYGRILPHLLYMSNDGELLLVVI